MTDTPNKSEPLSVTAHDLRNFGLFGALPENVLEHLAAHVTVIEVEPGGYLFREGDEANCMFVVLQGDLEVLKRSKGGPDSRVAVLGPGDWFGEMGVIDVQPRSASVLTVSPARFVKITSADLDRLYRFDVKAYALIVLNIAREMSRRLRVADGILADLIANVVDGYGRGPRKGSA
jgi:CRP/FNR family cyclic AMP-dependent transcriptional regulator